MSFYFHRPPPCYAILFSCSVCSYISGKLGKYFLEPVLHGSAVYVHVIATKYLLLFQVVIVSAVWTILLLISSALLAAAAKHYDDDIKILWFSKNLSVCEWLDEINYDAHCWQLIAGAVRRIIAEETNYRIQVI